MEENQEAGESVTRRDYLRIAGAAGIIGTAAVLTGCDRVAEKYLPSHTSLENTDLPARGDLSPAVRILDRVAFGAAAGDVAMVERIGIENYVNAQLAAPVDDSKEDIGLQLRLRGIAAGRENGYELREEGEKETLRQLQQAAILRAVYSNWQLRERMVDLWTNHFNIYGHKNYGAFLKGADDSHVVRPHALGKFPDMLRASAHSPAMLGYLDNQVNRRGVANENYARELMELHTLGVGGGYTQKDVQEVARCLTGWTIEDGFLKRRGSFRFDADRHDNGAKTVLGIHIPAGGGQSDGERVLDILASHPGTARFVSRKIVRHFLGHEDSGWTTKLAGIYQSTGGDIKAMLHPLLLSPDLITAPPVMKRPFDYLISVLHAANADTDGSTGIQGYLAAMGQPLFQWPMPDGYPDGTAAWSGSLLARWNFVFDLMAGRIQGTHPTLPKRAPTETLIALLLSRRADDPALSNLRQVIVNHTESAGTDATTEIAALLLAAPVFQWR